jgi:hypothetical protein
MEWVSAMMFSIAPACGKYGTPLLPVPCQAPSTRPRRWVP